ADDQRHGRRAGAVSGAGRSVSGAPGAGTGPDDAARSRAGACVANRAAAAARARPADAVARAGVVDVDMELDVQRYHRRWYHTDDRYRNARVGLDLEPRHGMRDSTRYRSGYSSEIRRHEFTPTAGSGRTTRTTRAEPAPVEPDRRSTVDRS